MTVRKDKDNWSDPLNLGSPVNTNFGENYPSVARNGNLYFFSCRNSGMGGCDIYVSHFKHNKYLPPENLGPTINSHKHDWDAFIAPDEAYLIFSSKDREDTIGDQDLYISFRSPQGQWSVAKNMGPKVNSTDDEICPSVTLDGKYLFFTSRRRGQADILWIDAAIISHLKSQK
jgi:Tol biopolymer transport system component